MTTSDAWEDVAEAALAEIDRVRTSDDGVGAAVAAAALASNQAAEEVATRDRIIRIARNEGASLRRLADATGVSRQTIANICAQPSTRSSQPRRARAS